MTSRGTCLRAGRIERQVPTLRWAKGQGVFAKLRKVTIGFIMSVCPHGTTQIPPEGFS